MNRYLKSAISIPFLVAICAFASGNNYKTHLKASRHMIIADQPSLDAGRKFFLSKGLKVSGGITWTADERNGVTFCYSDPKQLQKAIDRKSTRLNSSHL